ncbi:DUF6371 domain-containing protein [Flavobacterium sp.]|jgi:hypothetical protein|uniref:DUF6371 domain-containing protein n=1 Tax=Flavobacterium sp. TaxID=239 RepID=UPI003342CAB9
MTDYKLNSKNRFNVKSCPCGKGNNDGKFVPFDDFIKFGFCHSCGETFLPNIQSKTEIGYYHSQNREEKIIYIPSNYLDKSISNIYANNFVNFLKVQFGIEDTKSVIELYKIGSSNNWNGANIFWYIDKDNNVRTGKIMLYNNDSGKRIKVPYNHITWVHKKLKIPNENIRKCLFGEHLLPIYPNRPIALVESEKTAIIASLFFQDFIWMATGGISNLSSKYLEPLKNRKIILFPDIGAYDLWMEKTKKLEKSFDIKVSKYLEDNASIDDKREKYDVADFILNFRKKSS